MIAVVLVYNKLLDVIALVIAELRSDISVEILELVNAVCAVASNN